MVGRITVCDGIALGSVMAATRSEGLGIVPIGGIRLHPQALIDLLELPDHTFLYFPDVLPSLLKQGVGVDK